MGQVRDAEVVEANGNVYEAKVTSFVVLSCVVAASGGILYGYDLGISGGVTSMGTFLEKFFPTVYARMKEDTAVSNYCKFDSQLLTLFTSSLYVAGLVGSLLASTVTRTFGRRSSMLVGGAVFLAGAAAGGAAVNIYMLILGRALLGFGIGFTNQAIPVYLVEMAPPNYRGAISGSFELCVSMGILAANIINYGLQRTHAAWGWRVSLSLAAVPASVLAIGSFFLPETPNSLLQSTGDVEATKKLLQKIRGTANVQKELDDIVSACELSAAARNPFRQILQKKYRPQLVIAAILHFSQQFTGINVINFYAPVMFRTIGFKESGSLLSAAVTRSIATVFFVLSMATVDRMGRRKLFMIGGFQMIASLVVVGGVLEGKLTDHGAMNRHYGYLVLAVICVYVAGFAFSWGPTSWLVTTEILPLEIRSAGQSIAMSVNFLATFMIAQSFLAMLCHLKSAIFFLFAGYAMGITLFIYLMLPETKNLPIEQIDRVWKKHWFWKRFVGEGREDKELESHSRATECVRFSCTGSLTKEKGTS